MKKTLTTQQKLTFAILFFLLFIRIAPIQAVARLFSSIEPTQLDYYYSVIYYILTALVIGLNKNNLGRLHIDKPFIHIFMGVGVILFIYYPLTLVGVVVGSTVFTIFAMLYFGKFTFGITRPNYLQMFILFVLILIPLFGPISILALLFHTKFAWGTLPITSRLFLLPGTVYEEVLFRGTLWMLLSQLRFGEYKMLASLGNQVTLKNGLKRSTWGKQKSSPKKGFASFLRIFSFPQKFRSSRLTNSQIIFIQAFLFWISHYYYYSKLYIFWIVFPIISLLLGVMVHRSKSLTPSTIAHFLINVLVSS